MGRWYDNDNKGDFMIDEGRYVVRPSEWGITKTSKGDPCVFITFLNDQIGKITWFGNLKGKTPQSQEKVQAMTVKTLVTCGFAYKDLRKLEEIDALDSNKDVSIVIEHDVSPNGQTRARVKWVNAIGSLRAEGNELDNLLGGIDLKGQFIAAMQEAGVEIKKDTPIIQANNDIPF